MEIIQNLSDEELKEWLYRLQLDDLSFLQKYNRKKAIGAIGCLLKNLKKEDDEEIIEWFKSQRKRDCKNESTLNGFDTKDLSDSRLLIVKQNNALFCFDKNGDMDLLKQGNNPFTKEKFDQQTMDQINNALKEPFVTLEIEDLQEEINNLLKGKEYSVISVPISDLRETQEKLENILRVAGESNVDEYAIANIPFFASDYDYDDYMKFSTSEEWKNFMESIDKNTDREEVAKKVLDAIILNLRQNEKHHLALLATNSRLTNFMKKMELKNPRLTEKDRRNLKEEISRNEEINYLIDDYVDEFSKKNNDRNLYKWRIEQSK